MRAVLAILTSLIIAATSVLLGYSVQTISVICIVAVSIAFTSLVVMYNSIFQAFDKMHYQSVGLILNSALFLCLVAAGARVGYPLAPHPVSLRPQV
jgi:O-antigen/teichoic acid export membrane protein